MKFISINFLLTILTIINVHAQKHIELEPNGGGESIIKNNHVCISDNERISIIENLQENIDKYQLKGSKSKSLTSDFLWPLSKKSELDFYNYFALSNFVDHDNSEEILDYYCERRTYDSHRGTDFVMWPFPWYIYENEFVEVVAAKAGIIIGKEDGQFDQNCEQILGSPWNAVYLMHDDGYVSWYAHLKENSLTNKSIGDTVQAGEYLGLVASSGFSDTPHLHLEVYNSDGILVDPFSGNCNSSTSLWLSQKDYREPTVNAVFTHSKEPELGCPSVNEIPHFSNEFVPGDTIYFAAYFKDQIVDQSYNYSIIDPAGNVWQNWTHSSNDTYNVSWWYWYWWLPTEGPFGDWKFVVERDNIISEHQFHYGELSDVEEIQSSSIVIYPNPTNNNILLSGSLDDIRQIKVFNSIGETMIYYSQLTQEIDISNFAPGIYLIHIELSEGSVVKKILKN